ncbi:CG13876 [Drosophila busckii]|uniref:CG13876 n=1 Tax=Drosophila busckii TaxID=30019 RepID=A0A0M3QW61_DROBS|nr:uncharacterized protein C3orf38 homolog [Drosophila busckii]ALC43589.1 CG13876 [Drosophila busckii]
MNISEQHSLGLRDLLLSEQNTPVLLQLAKSVTKNVCSTDKPEEALEYLTAQTDDIHKLLHKRHITKEILFKYLHSRVPGTLTDFTKTDLVFRVIKYWDQRFKTGHGITTLTTAPAAADNDQQFPIHIIARKFGEWFFDKYNGNKLSLIDLWTDATLNMQVIADDGTNETECESAEEVISSLVGIKRLFGFHFNPNLLHSGVQGRMDAYGQVIVLCCGTLHSADTSVGVFECAFGLLRDPHQDNNWKPKKFKWLLRSSLCPITHTLEASETLSSALALPVPNDSLD